MIGNVDNTNIMMSSSDNTVMQMIIAFVISRNDMIESKTPWVQAHPVKAEKNERKFKDILTIIISKMIGSTVTIIDSPTAPPTVFLTNLRPAPTVRNDSPNAAPTIGIKFAAANLTVLAETESLAALIIF